MIPKNWDAEPEGHKHYDWGDTMDIGGAVNYLQSGSKLTRRGWNGKDMYLMLQVPDAHSKMTLPYVYMKTADNQLVPWLCSQTDLLATDWEVVR